MAEAQAQAAGCLRLLSLSDLLKVDVMAAGAVRFLTPLLESKLHHARWNARQVLPQPHHNAAGTYISICAPLYINPYLRMIATCASTVDVMALLRNSTQICLTWGSDKGGVLCQGL